MKVRTPRKLTIEVDRDELLLILAGLRAVDKGSLPVTDLGREARTRMDRVICAALNDLTEFADLDTDPWAEPAPVCDACLEGRCEACTDDGRRGSPSACECARSTHGPNGIGVVP